MDQKIKDILKPVPLETQGVCGTCRFQKRESLGATYNKCHAIGDYCSIAYFSYCKGKFWESKPAPEPFDKNWLWIMPMSLLSIFSLVGGILAALKYL